MFGDGEWEDRMMVDEAKKADQLFDDAKKFSLLSGTTNGGNVVRQAQGYLSALPQIVIAHCY
jgi:hypothetical protein